MATRSLRTPVIDRKKLPEYQVWKGMRQRCLNQTDEQFKDYGGRGIKICGRWNDFFAFLEDMGPRPSAKHTIDRFPDNNGNYEQSNCRWATMGEQNRNRRSNRLLTLSGRTQCAVKWAEELGITFSSLRYRLRKGWSDEEALTTPFSPQQSLNIMVTFQGRTQLLKEWCKEFGLRYDRVKFRFNSGWPVEKLFTTEDYRGRTSPAV